MPAKGINSEASLLTHAKENIGGFASDDGRQFVYSKYIAPAFFEVQFAKPLSRSAIGSMNDHIHAAKIYLAHGMEPSEIGYRLNVTPMSALKQDGKNYGRPEKVFASLVDRIVEM
jgi:hypothetical protein